jgi:transcriptional regulator with XRE-family HTH domain
MAKTSPFGAWLRKWRKARGLTQIQLAAAAKCTQSTISEHERGVKQEVGGDFIRPEPDLVERLATALGRPVEEARALAGYNPSPVRVTMSEVSEILKHNPGQGVFIDANNPTGYTLVPNSLLEDISNALKRLTSPPPNDSKS